jgi:cobaltochelatase CobN
MQIMNKIRPKLLFLINAALTGALADGAELFRQEHGNLFDIRVLAVSDFEEDAVSSEKGICALQEADMVFLDIRGGGKALSLCSRILPDTGQPVALLLGGSPELMALLRLGSFTMKQAAEKMAGKKGSPAEPNMARIERIMKLVETGGSLMPVGKLRHARNWMRIMRYWQHGGPENIKNLLVFAGQEYLGLKLPKAAEPMEYPEFGLFDPLSGRFYQELDEYRQQEGHDPAQPTVGLSFTAECTLPKAWFRPAPLLRS